MRQKTLISGLAISTVSVGITTYLLKDKSNLDKVKGFVRSVKKLFHMNHRPKNWPHFPYTKQVIQTLWTLKIIKWSQKDLCSLCNIIMKRNNELSVHIIDYVNTIVKHFSCILDRYCFHHNHMYYFRANKHIHGLHTLV